MGTAKAVIKPAHLMLESLEQRLALATFRVNTTLDTVAANLRTGVDAHGTISLRSAIMAADSLGGSHRIVVPVGVYTLTLPGANEDQAASGDLDLNGKITIQGSGATTTLIDGNHLDRVFDVHGGKITISNLLIRNGLVAGQVRAEGGGIKVAGNSGMPSPQVTLNSVVIKDNEAKGSDGLDGSTGESASGTGTLRGGNGSNARNGSTASGGGICVYGASLKINRCAIADNTARGGRGGNGGLGAAAFGVAGAVGKSGQEAVGGSGGLGGSGGWGIGGGIYSSGPLTITNSSFTFNWAIGGAGGGGGDGFIGSGGVGGDGGVSSSGEPGFGGNGTGGDGGNGGMGGAGTGGGIAHDSVLVFAGSQGNLLTANYAVGGDGGVGGLGGHGIGGKGGNSPDLYGGFAGDSTGGRGGVAGVAGNALGGGIYNRGPIALSELISKSSLNLEENKAIGGAGGRGGNGGPATGLQGGRQQGIHGNAGGHGGDAVGGPGGSGGRGGNADGGALYNEELAKTVLTRSAGWRGGLSTTFLSNLAEGGSGGAAGDGGKAQGGDGGSSWHTTGGRGGNAQGGLGARGGAAGSARGGAVYNNGKAILQGITLDLRGNTAANGIAAGGGIGGNASSGYGGDGFAGASGGAGGSARAGDGGSGGFGAISFGGGIYNGGAGTLLINPRLGAPRGSGQSKATNTLSGNASLTAAESAGGKAGTPTVGLGGSGSTQGASGTPTPGLDGMNSTQGNSFGGGVSNDISGTATIKFSTISGNSSSDAATKDTQGTITR